MDILNSPVISALLPVIMLIFIGFLAGRFKLVRGEAVNDLSQLVFWVLVQALLFKTMAKSNFASLQLGSVFLYYTISALLFAAVMFVKGRSAASAVTALAAIFSNTIMIGVPLVQLSYGQDGLTHLFAIISMHALVLLTMATIVIELILAGESNKTKSLTPAILNAVKNSIIHPVPLPIIAGFLYSLTGWGLHPVIERPLDLLGKAFGPIALLLVGITLANIPRKSMGQNMKDAVQITIIKNIIHPVLILGGTWIFGVRGILLEILVIAAALPVGTNVFLFSKRYQTKEELVTTSLAVSTVVAIGTLFAIMISLQFLK